MTTIELVRERLVPHVGPDEDLTLLQRRYRVEGHDELLIATIYIDDLVAEMPGQIDKARQACDEEAQFLVEHPLPEEPPQPFQK